MLVYYLWTRSQKTQQILVHALLVNTAYFCAEKVYLATAFMTTECSWQEDKYGSALEGDLMQVGSG